MLASRCILEGHPDLAEPAANNGDANQGDRGRKAAPTKMNTLIGPSAPDVMLVFGSRFDPEHPEQDCPV